MSLRRFGRGILQILFNRLGLLHKVVKAPPQVVLRQVARRIRSPNYYSFLRYAFRSYGRPVLSTLNEHRFRYQRLHLATTQGKRFQFRYGREIDSLFAVRNLFGTKPRFNQALRNCGPLPESLDGYDIGTLIACGCHAAVYELKVRSELSTSAVQDEVSTSSNTNYNQEFPLALKLMFNYHFELPDQHLWNEMGAEILPLRDTSNQRPKLAGTFHRIELGETARHPNVIRLYTAFVDRMPILNGAKTTYPEALPTSDIYDYVITEPRTMFIVMKRYRMTLRQYMLTMRRNYWAGRIMLGQLLEAVVYLYEHVISHRDLKSDNVLLDFDHQGEVPHLVIADFGCALATGSWDLPYENDSVDLGGNLALRPPEIRNAQAGPGCQLNYRAADLWAAGTLAYEIFTRSDYLEAELPVFPQRVDSAIASVVDDILKRDPTKRVDCRVAANVVSISLFRFGDDLRHTLLCENPLAAAILTARSAAKTVGKLLQQTVDNLVNLYAVETVLFRRISPDVLRATFLARLDREHLSTALNYFLDNVNDEN